MTTKFVSQDKQNIPNKHYKRLEGSEEALLRLWLSMSSRERSEQFVDSMAAAELVGISQRTVRYWIECGSVEAVQIGKKFRIDKKSLIDFVTTHAIQGQ